MKVFVTTSLALCSGVQLARPNVRADSWKPDTREASSFEFGNQVGDLQSEFVEEIANVFQSRKFSLSSRDRLATSSRFASRIKFGSQTYELQSKLDAEIANGFQSRDLVMPFDDRLSALSKAASSDPCEAKVLTGGLGMNAGFGARATLATSEIQLALYFNLTFAICDGDFTHPGIAWRKYFDNVAGFSVCSDPVKCLRSETSAGWIGNSMTGQLKLVDEHFQVSLLQTVIRSLYTYNSDTLTRAQIALRNAGFEVRTQYIGVHVRRGDKLSEARLVPSEEYAALVLEKLLRNSISTVFIASDDKHAGDEMLAALQASIPGVTVLQLFSESSDTHEHYHDEDDTAMALLTDIFALSRAKIFIGTQSSGTSRLVRFLRGPDDLSISIDGDWLESYE